MPCASTLSLGAPLRILRAAPGNFVEATAQPVLQFRHRVPDASREYLIETVGSGVALFNGDNDGRKDAVAADRILEVNEPQ